MGVYLPMTIELTEADNQALELGLAAANLLNDYTFNQVMNDLANQYMQEIVNSEPLQAKERDGFYFAIKAIQDIRAALHMRVAVKEQIAANLNEEN